MEDYLDGIESDIIKSCLFINSVKAKMLQSASSEKSKEETAESWEEEHRGGGLHYLKNQLVESTVTHWKLGLLANVKAQLANYNLGRPKASTEGLSESEKEQQIIKNIREKIEKLRQN